MGRKVSLNEYEIEPVHGTKHRRKHPGRNVSRNRTSENGDSSRNDSKFQISSDKYRRHKHKENDTIFDENRRMNVKVEDSVPIEIMDELKEKSLLLTRAKNKHGKLEKTLQEKQSEFEKVKTLLDQRESELRELYARHENSIQLVESLEQEKINWSKITKKLNDENAQYKEDVSLLKILIYRLNVEIERYQDKIRISNPDENQNVEFAQLDGADIVSENNRVSQSWGRVNFHALGPLLEAYQENLAEKEQLIKQYGNEINHFSGRCKEVVVENETLRTEIEEITLRYEKCMNEMKLLREDATIVKQQNDLLTKQIAVQKIQIQDIHGLYEKKVESMSQDNNKLHTDYLACTTELSNLRGKYEILNEGYEKLKKNTEKTMPVSVHTSAIEECKRLFEELKVQYDSDKKKLTEQVKHLEESNPQSERQLVIITAERDQLKRQTKILEKNLKRTQHKLEYLQRNICSIQISRDSFKRQLHKTTAYCEQLVDEHEKLVSERERLISLLNEREKENENIQYLGNNIAHRMGNLKSQLQSVQKGAKEQLESVEKHIRTQEKGVGRMKIDYNRELERLKNLVKQKEDVIGKLQREKFATRDNLELVWRAATSDDKKVKDALKNTKIHNI
ncbi:centrosomal protein of 89 kDa isoform X2 [Venturia canescens]|nr:centrosomal protein of 89 kDa isoform X2 [Venturia canescens]XP_043267194.1 centrosomal protein of 89 kDa isoform X2 [Venturia canescens]